MFAPVLHGVDLAIPRGGLTLIVGPVGAGKSALLKTLLGETHVLEGSVCANGRIAYCPQESFLLNNLLRTNIVFGEEFSADKYARVIELCELGPDIRSLQAGEFTEIGENGINLSGGQRQRISLARALYIGGDIFLIDDSFSALDAHVGKKIFENAVLNELVAKEKTVVMVTHALAFLEKAHHIVYIDKGRVECQGTYAHLLSTSDRFKDFVLSSKCSGAESQDSLIASEPNTPTRFNYSPEMFDEFFKDHHSEASIPYVSESIDAPRKPSLGLSPLRSSPQIPSSTGNHTQNLKVVQGRLTKKERRERGEIKRNVFSQYFSSGGPCFFAGILVLFALLSASIIWADYLISAWTSDKFDLPQSTYVFMCLGMIGFTFAINTAKGLSYGCYVTRIGLRLFESLLGRIVKKPMEFFDTTPIGQLLNLTGKDSDRVDIFLASETSNLIDGAARLLGVFVLVSVANYFMIPLFFGTARDAFNYRALGRGLQNGRLLPQTGC